MQTAERISHVEKSDHVIFQRSLFAYLKAAEMVKGHVVEIGTGMGYGLTHLFPKADFFTAVDKYKTPAIDNFLQKENFRFIQRSVPPIPEIEDQSVDYVVSFQVIEHIKNDRLFVQEISRILKKGGQALITTPNRPMSITRNPWHIREYTHLELKELLTDFFEEVEIKGVFGNEKPMAYYERNKASVQKFKRFDFLDLEHRLPGWILRIPYDILNRINRNKLLKENDQEVLSITTDDYFLKEANASCFDLFALVKK